MLGIVLGTWNLLKENKSFVFVKLTFRWDPY